ncbi:FtsX-like permease family protein [Thalassococcus sp. BH17M4-6]|uniref:FtsX-like permease family protein n=1 Tax=Thalassococcus sp. BH17M4-6 TaxID=3413148 RepID=UPI003BDD20F1
MNRAAFAALFAHWRRHPVQIATLCLGLMLATALWSGVQAVNAEARRSYDSAAATLGQDALQRLVGPGRIALEEYVALRRAGWNVSPVIDGSLRAGDTRLRILGVDPLTSPPQAGLTALLDGDAEFGPFITQPGRMLVAPETAARLEGADLPPRIIAADVPPGTAIVDIGIAQTLLGQDGFDHLLLARDQPMGLTPLNELTDLQIRDAPQGGDMAQLTQSFHLNLTAFGLLSFAVGLFIVQSAIGLAFEQRRPTFRTLRALGLGLRRLVLLLMAELLGIAVLAGLAGIALGYAIAAALLPGVAGTLRGLYGAEVSGSLSFDPGWALAALAITLLGVAAAGSQALWQVARMPLLAPAQPRAWARASQTTIRAQLAASAGLLLAAVALAVWGQSLIAGFACLAALLIGAALALPALLIGLLRLADGLVRSALGEWLLADARQQVPALSLALMALLLALAANVGVGTMVGSFRQTFTGWLDQRLVAELYVTARTEAEAEDIRTYLAPRADALLPIWSVDLPLRGAPGEVFGIVDHPTYSENWPLLQAVPEVWSRVTEDTGVLINEQLARREGIALGESLTLTDDWALPVVGVYSDYGNTQGQAITGIDGLATRFPDAPRLRYAVRIAPDAVPALQQDLRQRFDLPDRNVIDQQAVKRFSLEVFDRTFLVTGTLNVLTLGVASFAMLTSLLTLSGLRLPQLAPVWALGLTPARLARFEVARTVLLALLTWALAVPLGLVLAWVLLTIVNVEAFGWRLPMSVFPTDWLWLGLWAVVAALLACAWPVLRLTRVPAGQLLRVFAHER